MPPKNWDTVGINVRVGGGKGEPKQGKKSLMENTNAWKALLIAIISQIFWGRLEAAELITISPPLYSLVTLLMPDLATPNPLINTPFMSNFWRHNSGRWVANNAQIDTRYISYFWRHIRGRWVYYSISTFFFVTFDSMMGHSCPILLRVKRDQLSGL